MPDRIVRAGILTSDPVNLLSWAAEVFYRRLFSVVDDYGRYDARPTLLRAHLYPLKIDRVSDADVGKWLTECVTAGLVSVYQVSGQQCLEVAKFGQRVRADKSKWPAPPTSADICQQPLSNAAVFVSVSEVVSVVASSREGPDSKPETQAAGTSAGAICKAMRQAGLSDANPGDPRLLALVAQGATAEEFVGLAQEAIKKRINAPWGWILKVLQQRRAEAAEITLAPAVLPSQTTASDAAAKTAAEQARAQAEYEAKRNDPEEQRKIADLLAKRRPVKVAA